jgi:hypothetical protein
LLVTDYEQIKSRKTVEEKPHKRLSFLDEESLRRRSDSRMLESPMGFPSKGFVSPNTQFLYPFYKSNSEINQTPIGGKPNNLFKEEIKENEG